MTILKWSRHKLLGEQCSPFRHVLFQEEMNHNAKKLDVRPEYVLEAKFLGIRLKNLSFLDRFWSIKAFMCRSQ